VGFAGALRHVCDQANILGGNQVDYKMICCDLAIYNRVIKVTPRNAPTSFVFHLLNK